MFMPLGCHFLTGDFDHFRVQCLKEMQRKRWFSRWVFEKVRWYLSAQNVAVLSQSVPIIVQYASGENETLITLFVAIWYLWCNCTDCLPHSEWKFPVSEVGHRLGWKSPWMYSTCDYNKWWKWLPQVCDRGHIWHMQCFMYKTVHLTSCTDAQRLCAHSVYQKICVIVYSAIAVWYSQPYVSDAFAKWIIIAHGLTTVLVRTIRSILYCLL